MYEGEWNESRRHGKGKQIWPSGNIYDGEWKLNVKHGTGRFYKEATDEWEFAWYIHGERQETEEKTADTA